MADPLRERTERLLTDYLELCARGPGAPEPEPASLEAALLRVVATELRRRNQASGDSDDRSDPGNRLEVLARRADSLLPGHCRLTWERVVALVTFAGTLLEPGPEAGGPRGQDAAVRRDCRDMVALLSARLAGLHRGGLEDQGGWNGFCLSVMSSFARHHLKKLLFQTFLYYLFIVSIVYFWRQL